MRLLLALMGCATLGVMACGGGVADGTDAGAVADAHVEALSDWLSISDVAVFQGPKAPIFANGADVQAPKTPVIANRPAMVRAYFGVAPGKRLAHRLNGELHVTANGTEIAVVKADALVDSSSSDDAPQTALTFALDASALAPEAGYSIVVHDESVAAGDPNGVLALPSDGSTLPFHADATAPELKVTLLPVEYDADTSGRLPDTSATQIARFHDTLYRMYPAAKVTMTVASPMPFSTTIDAAGAGWDALVQATMDRRVQDNAADDVYYVALFATTSTFKEYCSNGCIGGVGLLDGASYPDARVAVVAGYDVQFAADTLNQELAHSMGREHAPCGNPDTIDPKFPYADGGPGVWGYDVLAASFVGPNDGYADFMSYCRPIWVSDYTYAGLYGEMKLVQKTKLQKNVLPPQQMRAVRVFADGSVRDAGLVHVSAPPTSRRTVDLVDAEGRLAPSTYVSYGKLGGGLALVPLSSAGRIVHARL